MVKRTFVFVPMEDGFLARSRLTQLMEALEKGFRLDHSFNGGIVKSDKGAVYHLIKGNEIVETQRFKVGEPIPEGWEVSSSRIYSTHVVAVKRGP